MNSTRLLFTTLIACPLLLALSGCYEKVTYSRQYPGWNIGNAAAPPAGADYSNAGAVIPNQKSSFDPIGDMARGLGGVARGIGNLGASLGGDSNSGGSNTNPPSGNASSSSKASTSAPPPSNNNQPPSADSGDGRIGGRSPFDTNPE